MKRERRAPSRAESAMHGADPSIHVQPRTLLSTAVRVFCTHQSSQSSFVGNIAQLIHIISAHNNMVGIAGGGRAVLFDRPTE